MLRKCCCGSRLTGKGTLAGYFVRRRRGAVIGRHGSIRNRISNALVRKLLIERGRGGAAIPVLWTVARQLEKLLRDVGRRDLARAVF